MNGEGRERFFRAIAERIDADRVEEVHVFPAIRQGGRESGVAVVMIRLEEPDGEVAESSEQYIPEPAAEPVVITSVAVDELAGDFMEAPAPAAGPDPLPRRFTVLRANYVLTLKGPDRGKWEVGVVEEADAPAATVNAVVRGVHERAGGWEGGAEVPERLTGDDFRAALIEEPWTATR